MRQDESGDLLNGSVIVLAADARRETQQSVITAASYSSVYTLPLVFCLIIEDMLYCQRNLLFLQIVNVAINQQKALLN